MGLVLPHLYARLFRTDHCRNEAASPTPAHRHWAPGAVAVVVVVDDDGERLTEQDVHAFHASTGPGGQKRFWNQMTFLGQHLPTPVVVAVAVDVGPVVVPFLRD